jgi:hypothetical protein
MVFNKTFDNKTNVHVNSIDNSQLSRCKWVKFAVKVYSNHLNWSIASGKVLVLWQGNKVIK